MEEQSSGIQFAEDMLVRQVRFFANAKNKTRFIRALADHIERVGIRVKQATADEYTLIVSVCSGHAACLIHA